MTNRICGCPVSGPRLREGHGAKLGTCSCCKMLGGVIDLPVCVEPDRGLKTGGKPARDVATPFCGPCLNPAYKAPRLAGTSGIRRGKNGIRTVAFTEIPPTLRLMLSNDHAPEPNAHPSAQRQKAAARRQEEYDE